MHPPVFEYVAAAVAKHGPFATVVEIGSRDVNGTVRSLFGDAEYLGMDLRPGPNVLVVADAAVWRADKFYEYLNGALVDCVVCTEVLEHAPNAERICANAMHWLRPGGVFIVTAAAHPRAPHSAIDEQPIRPDEHYRNITAADLRSWLASAEQLDVDVSVPGDIRALAVKA